MIGSRIQRESAFDDERESPVMRRRVFLETLAKLGVIAGASPFLPTGVAHSTEAKTPVEGGTLIVTTSAEPTVLVSAYDSNMSICMVGSKILEGLVTYDVDLNPVPALAKSWEVAADGLSVTFHLRDNVLWHDGKPFTAEDVAFSLLNVWKIHHPFGRAVYANVTGVETPDDHTVVIRLSGPAQYIFAYINTYGSQILPKHIYEGTDIRTNPANLAPIGTGPFVFKEWQRGSHVRLARNPNYWQAGRPHLDEVVFRFIPDAAARAVAVESGEVHLALGSAIPIASLGRFADQTKYRINTDDGRFLSSIYLVQFNTRRPYLADRRVRQAFLHAVDREALRRLVFRGYGKIATGPVPSSVKKYYTDQTPQYPFDPKRAAALLDEAGFPVKADGSRLKVTLDYGSPDDQRQVDFIKLYLGKIGVDVELRSSDISTYLRYIYTDQDYDLSVSSLHMLPDPTLGVQRLYWSKNIRKGAPWTNGAGYSNPDLDRIMEAAQKENGDQERRELIRQWQRIAQEELPILDLIELTWVTIASQRVIQPSQQGDGLFASLADVWLDKA